MMSLVPPLFPHWLVGSTMLVPNWSWSLSVFLSHVARREIQSFFWNHGIKTCSKFLNTSQLFY